MKYGCCQMCLVVHFKYHSVTQASESFSLSLVRLRVNGVKILINLYICTSQPISLFRSDFLLEETVLGWRHKMQLFTEFLLSTLNGVPVPTVYTNIFPTVFGVWRWSSWSSYLVLFHKTIDISFCLDLGPVWVVLRI